MIRWITTCVNPSTTLSWILGSFLSFSMNEIIMCKVMVRIQEDRTKAKKWQGTICPNVFKKLKLDIERSAKSYVLWNGQDGFEVKEKDKMKFTVNLGEGTCSCRY